MLKRFLAGALLTLVLMAAVVAPVAAATHITVCFIFQGKEYCIDIPLAVNLRFKVPPDKPNTALDISTVMDSFEAVYKGDAGQSAWLKSLVESEGQQTQWFLFDAKGEHVVLLDMANQAAVEVDAETQIGN